MGLVKYLDWDSYFFGFNIGRINIDNNQLSPKTLGEAISEARASNIKCLYLEIPFGLPEVLGYCSEKRFLLVDFKTTLSKTLSGKKGESSLDNITCEIKDEYYPFLEKIVEEISRQSRYANDPKFGIKNSLLLYKEWLKKSIYEKFCNDFIIYTYNQKPVGFITLKIKNGIPFIDLLGVSNDAQVKGISGSLIEGAERRLFEAEYKVLKVITQGHNIKALKAYQSKKFKIENVNIFYHKWIG